MKMIMASLHEAFLEAQAFLQRRYPPFVTSDSAGLGDGEAPIFVFHSIDPTLFQGQLEYLVTNGYRTVTADELSDHLLGRRRLAEKSVLLTIDDGRSSVWTYAYPLLKKYGCTATVFLIPGYTREGASYSPHLEDFWAEKAARNEVLDRDRTHEPLLTWSEIEEMHKSRVVDFQSHSLYHHKIFAGSQIVDFFGPATKTLLYDLPLPYKTEETFQEAREQFFGMPLYASQPLLSGCARYFDDTELRHTCMDYAQAHIDNARFAKDAKAALGRIVAEYQRKHGLQGRTAALQERDAEMRDNLQKSKRLIEERLNKTVRHFCYPYGVGSARAVSLSQEAGYVTNFWTLRNDRRTNQPGDDPLYCVRLKNDFIFRLPGKDRQSLWSIFQLKLARRLRGQPVY